MAVVKSAKNRIVPFTGKGTPLFHFGQRVSMRKPVRQVDIMDRLFHYLDDLTIIGVIVRFPSGFEYQIQSKKLGTTVTLPEGEIRTYIYWGD